MSRFQFDLLWIVFYVYMFVAWIVNLVQLINCDFASPYKEEVTHLVGLLFFPASMITCWY